MGRLWTAPTVRPSSHYLFLNHWVEFKGKSVREQIIFHFLST